MERTPDSRYGAWIRSVLAGLLVAAALTGPLAPPASAVTFSISPTQLVLSGRTSSALLTVRNESTETLQFQLSAFAWQQSPTGEMQLDPTTSIVFFPALFTLAPGEERRVRVGSPGVPASSREQTYRLFVEELPPPAAGARGGVRVLTKMGIPIFLRPAKESASATLDGLQVRGGALSFTLANTGAVHFIPRRIVARGLDAAGAPLFEESVAGWYVLAGGRRQFELKLPAAACGRTRSFVVEAELPFALLTERIETATGACSP